MRNRFIVFVLSSIVVLASLFMLFTTIDMTREQAVFIVAFFTSSMCVGWAAKP